MDDPLPPPADADDPTGEPVGEAVVPQAANAKVSAGAASNAADVRRRNGVERRASTVVLLGQWQLPR
ncbi:hypothetical protein [Blastococcus sp. SYSU DS0617]